MNWDDLKYVLEIHRAGTLSEAAAKLGVSHTTAGRRLRAIEEALGVRLFDRTPDGFVVTPAGAEAAEAAAQTERRLHELERRILGGDDKLTGELRVTTMDVFFLCMHDAFSSFTERYSGVELTVMSSNEEASLTRREADVALRMTNAPPDYLVGRRVGRVKFAPYASSDMARAAGPDARLQDFPWLGWDRRMNVRFLEPWLARHAPGARVVLRTDFDSLVLREAIAAGVGVHFISCLDGDQDPRLTRIGPVVEEFCRDLWLLTLPELRGSTRVRAFMDHMHEELTSYRDALAGHAPR